ncbi:unnamed protein product, partial [Ectocarpus fasciculatus]
SAGSKFDRQTSESSVCVVNPMFEDGSGEDRVPSETAAAVVHPRATRGGRHHHHHHHQQQQQQQQQQDRPGQFQRYLLSKSPRTSGTGPGFSRSSSRGERGSGGAGTSRVFETFGGSGSASMKSSIDAHLTAAGGRFYSNTDGGDIPVPMDASSEAGSSQGRKLSGSSISRQLHGDDDDGLPPFSAGRGMAGRRQGDRASAPFRVETAVTTSTVAAAAAAAAAAAEEEAAAAAADANRH